MNWQKVVVLTIYVVGALLALTLSGGTEKGEAIAYVLAGAAANQTAVMSTRDRERQLNSRKHDTIS